ncbi:hypothetical protein BY458DRAFT_530497 [Sporodiniella umbellata]|nr:hypothetical protein BY458DRAFT_530497 [Sporodiniella umbellata]
MLRLSSEIIYSICDLLSGQSLLELSFTAQRFCDLLNKKDSIWRKRCFDEFQLSHSKWNQRTWKNIYYNLLHAPLCLFRENEDGWSHTEIHLPNKSRPQRWTKISSTFTSLYALNKLGQLWSLDYHHPQSLLKPVKGRLRFVSISTYFYYCLGLTEDNKLYKIQGVEVQKLPGQFKNRPKQILVHGDYTLVLTDVNDLCFLEDQKPPIWIEWKEDPIIQLAVLQEFILALTTQGRLWQLRLQDIKTFSNSLKEHRVELVHFSGTLPRTIHSNYDQFAVCTEGGEVLMGQSGVYRNTEPVKLDFLQNQSVCAVSFGCGHNAAWTKTGEVITWKMVEGVSKVERNEDVELKSKDSLGYGHALNVAFGFKYNFAALVVN